MAVKPSNILSHWYTLLEGLHLSSHEFYSSLEAKILEKKIPKIKITLVDYHESSALSAKRIYLRVRRKNQIFDICAAPFGTDFFISWWFGELEGCLSSIPIIGWLIRKFLPNTYYQMDTALMFQEIIRLAVLTVMDEIIKAKGLRSLTESERKPNINQLFKK